MRREEQRRANQNKLNACKRVRGNKSIGKITGYTKKSASPRGVCGLFVVGLLPKKKANNNLVRGRSSCECVCENIHPETTEREREKERGMQLVSSSSSILRIRKKIAHEYTQTDKRKRKAFTK